MVPVDVSWCRLITMPLTCIVLNTSGTGYIKEFSEVENSIENVMKTTNPIGKFYTLEKFD